MTNNLYSLFFKKRDFDYEIKSKLKSLKSSDEILFNFLREFCKLKKLDINFEKLDNLFLNLTKMPFEDSYKGYLTHPIRVTFSFIDNLNSPNYDDVSLALCHNIIEMGFEKELKKTPELISEKVWNLIDKLTINREKSKNLEYLNVYYDNINKEKNLMLLKALDKLDNTLWWVQLDHVTSYDVLVVKEFVCPRVKVKNKDIADYLNKLTDYVLDKKIRLNYSKNN